MYMKNNELFEIVDQYLYDCKDLHNWKSKVPTHTPLGTFLSKNPYKSIPIELFNFTRNFAEPLFGQVHHNWLSVHSPHMHLHYAKLHFLYSSYHFLYSIPYTCQTNYFVYNLCFVLVFCILPSLEFIFL